MDLSWQDDASHDQVKALNCWRLKTQTSRTVVMGLTQSGIIFNYYIQT